MGLRRGIPAQVLGLGWVGAWACRCLQRHGNAFGQGHLGTGVGAGVGGGVGLPESVSGHGAVSTSFKNTFFFSHYFIVHLHDSKSKLVAHNLPSCCEVAPVSHHPSSA